MMPFRTIGMRARDRSQSTSRHVRAALIVFSAATAKAEPTSGEGPIRSSPISAKFAIVRPSGRVKAFRSSRSRRPRTGVSTVTHRAS
jgi:hypothetical protein